MTTLNRAYKVYGLRGWRQECVPAANGSRQTREIVAAKSKAAAMRAFGCTRHEIGTYCSVTGNEAEVKLAMSKPGTVFWTPANGRFQENPLWTEVKK